MTAAEKQRETARHRANETRAATARLRNAIHTGTHEDGRRAAAAFLRDPEEPANAIRVGALVTAVKWMHASRALTMIARSGISNPDKRVRDLTDRQRRALADRLAGWLA